MKEDHIFLLNVCVQIKKISGEPNSGQMVMHIASAKILEHEGSTSPSSFYGQLLDY